MNKMTFNERNIEPLLKSLKESGTEIVIPDTFTLGVMDRIRSDETTAITAFDAIYKKFLIIGSVAAAAAILIALNFILSYNPFSSEFAMLDILNVNLF